MNNLNYKYLMEETLKWIETNSDSNHTALEILIDWGQAKEKYFKEDFKPRSKEEIAELEQDFLTEGDMLI